MSTTSINFTPISAIPNQGKSGSRASDKPMTAEEKINKHKNQFLKLLTVQLTNQDPTNPMDTAQMSSQIFALSGIEQQLEGNLKLEKISNLLANQQISQHAGFIGKGATYEGEEFEVLNGKGDFEYILPAESAVTLLEIKDQKNNTVFTGELKTNVGEHKFQWDGKDKNGDQVKDGYYSFVVTAISKEDVKINIPVQSFGSGKIDSIINYGNEYKYGINGQEISIDQIKRIHDYPQKL